MLNHPTAHTRREPGCPATALADVLRSTDALWGRLCDVCVWSLPVNGKPIHSDASALALMLYELGSGSLHRGLRDEFVAAGGHLLGAAVGAMEREAIDDDVLAYWSNRCGFECPARAGSRVRHMFVDDDADDGEYPPELYDPEDMTLVPVMIPEEAEKTVWLCKSDGSVVVVPG